MKKFAFICLTLLPLSSMAASFEAQFKEIIPLCEQLFFPNSMAREPGFDINANQRKIEKQIEERSSQFHSRDGLSYLKKRLSSERDEVAQACIRRILKSSPASEPNPSFKRDALKRAP